ncbi:MAG: hypothetical protein ABR583_07825 [Gaiellaceae bacterium]
MLYAAMRMRLLAATDAPAVIEARAPLDAVKDFNLVFRRALLVLSVLT